MRRFGYYWKEGLRNIFKHGFMSIAAIAIMVACLILTGTVTLIAYNIDLSIVDLQQSNEIVVWIDENLTTREAKDLQPQFEKISNIATVEFEDRDVALEKYREELGEDSSILEDYNSSNNPLRNSYILTLKDSTQAEETISDIEMIEYRRSRDGGRPCGHLDLHHLEHRKARHVRAPRGDLHSEDGRRDQLVHPLAVRHRGHDHRPCGRRSGVPGRVGSVHRAVQRRRRRHPLFRNSAV